MKKTLLFLWLGCSPAVTGFCRAQDAPPPPPPHEDHAPQPEARERVNKETGRFQEDMHQHMQEAMQKAAQLDAEGKKDEAEALRRDAHQKMQAAMAEHQEAMQEKMREMRSRTRADRPAGDHAGEEPRPEGPRRPEGPDQRPDGPPPPPPELERKLHHVEQAIDHLRAAGLADPAANLERLADRLRRALRDQEGRPPEGGPRPDRGPRPEGRRPEGGPRRDDELGALRREVEELKQAVRELREGRRDEGPKESREPHH